MSASWIPEKFPFIWQNYPFLHTRELVLMWQFSISCRTTDLGRDQESCAVIHLINVVWKHRPKY